MDFLAQHMAYMLDFERTERAHLELLSHHMIGNSIDWWQGLDGNLANAHLASMEMQEIIEILEV